MALRLRNVVVIGKSDFSTSILRALAHASNDCHPRTSAKHGEAIHNDYVEARPSYNSNHHHSSLYNLTLLTRPHQSSHPADNIHHQTSDYSLSSLATAFQDADVVISTIAPADIPFQKQLIDAAIAAHVAHFIPCEFSYDTQDAKIRDAFPPCAARAEILDYLKEKSGQWKGFTWTALATGCPLERGLADGLLAFDMTWKSATIYGGGDETFPCSTLRKIGEAVVQLLGELQEGRREEYLYRCEFITSQNAILAAIEGIEGRSWDVSKAEVGECVREGKTRMDKGFFDGAMMLLERNILYGEVANMDVWTESSRIDDVKLEQVIKDVIDQVERNGKPDCGCG